MKRIKFLFATTLTLVVLNGFVYGQDTTLTVTSDGNVGIGTTNPAFLLDVFGTNYKVRYNSGGNVDVLINRASNSNFGNLQYASDNTLLWAIGLRGVSAADGLFFHDEDAGISRMMIDGTSGNVGIGTTSPSFPLVMGSGAHVTTGGVWTDASSRQYKENISTLTPEEAIAALEKLNPVRFNYKVEKDEEYVGFIAEDVPDLVATKDRQSLSPMDIVAVLTKVVQQQQKKIAELEARFNDSQ